MKHSKSLIIILFILFSSSNLLKAGVETVNNRISGNMIINSASVFVQDINYPNTELSGSAKVVTSSSKVILGKNILLSCMVTGEKINGQYSNFSSTGKLVILKS